MGIVKRLDYGTYQINDFIVERVDEYNDNETLVIRWELRDLNDNWLGLDSYETLREAKQAIINKWVTI